MLKIHRLVPESLPYYFGRERGQEPGYYTDHHEPTPRWLRTAGLEGLEVGAEIDVEMAYCIFEGLHPVTGEPLRDHEVGEIKDVTVMEDVLDEQGRPVLGPDGKPLRQPVLDENGNPVVQKRSQVIGLDLTFSAVKSVSVLWGLADDKQKALIEAAHREAIDTALSYLEREAAMVRRGKGGQDFLRAEIVAVEAAHRASRAKDPHLHTHVLLAALGLGADGRWTSIDTRAIYNFSKTAGMVYQAALREALTRDLEVAWEVPNEHGLAEIAGVPEDLLRHFSKRRGQIVGKVLEHNGDISDPCHTSAAQRSTRSAKASVTDEEYREVWASEARKIGWDRDRIWRRISDARFHQMTKQEELAEVVAAAVENRRVNLTWSWKSRRGAINAIASVTPWMKSREQQAAAILSQVTYLSTTFRRQDLERALIVAGCPLKELDEAVDAVLALNDCVRIGGEDAGRDAARQALGMMTGSEDREIFTSREVLEAELALLNAAIEGIGDRAGFVAPEIVDLVLAQKNEESLRAGFGGVADEQAELVRKVTSGDRLTVVQAQAGAGKTYSMSIAVEAWQRAGVPVLGTVVSQSATEVLAEETGIECRNIAKLINELDRGERTLEQGTVLVVDEAGMIGTRALKRLHDEIAAVNGKLILVGDRKQVGAVEAGGLFRSLQEHAPGVVVQMTANRRQRQEWEKQVLQTLWEGPDSKRDGWMDEVVGAYQERGRIVVGDGALGTQMLMVQRYFAAREELEDEGGVLMIAARRRDVRALDQIARAEAERRGELGAHVEFAGRKFRANERILTTKTDQKLGMANGTLGSVVGVEERPSEWAVTYEPVEKGEAMQPITGETEYRRRQGNVTTITRRQPAGVGETITTRKGAVGRVLGVEPVVKAWSVTIDAPGGVRTVTRTDRCRVGEIIRTRGGGEARVLGVEPARVSYQTKVRWEEKNRVWTHKGSQPPEIGKVVKTKGGYFRVVAAEPKKWEPHLIVATDKTRRTDDGEKMREQIAIPEHYVRDGYVTGGYATTVHKSQGVTCETGLTYAVGMDRSLLYVAASRGKGHPDDEGHILNNTFFVPVEVEVSEAASRELQELTEELRKVIEETEAYRNAKTQAIVDAGIRRGDGERNVETEIPDHLDPSLEFSPEEAEKIATLKEQIAALHLREALGRSGDELTSQEQLKARKWRDANLQEKRNEQARLARLMLTAPKGAEERRAEVEARLEKEQAEFARLQEQGASAHVLNQRAERLRALEKKIVELTPREGYTPKADLERETWLLLHAHDIEEWKKVSRDVAVTEEQLVALAHYEEPKYLPPMPDLPPGMSPKAVEGFFDRQLNNAEVWYRDACAAVESGNPIATLDQIIGLEIGHQLSDDVVEVSKRDTLAKLGEGHSSKAPERGAADGHDWTGKWVAATADALADLDGGPRAQRRKLREQYLLVRKLIEDRRREALKAFDDRKRWKEAVVAISTYRDRWQVEDDTVALPVVDEARQNELWRRDYEEALRKLAELANEGLDVGAANLLQLAEAGLVNLDDEQLRDITEELGEHVVERVRSSVRHIGVAGHSLIRAA